jgi:hypothetical protein
MANRPTGGSTSRPARSRRRTAEPAGEAAGEAATLAKPPGLGI